MNHPQHHAFVKGPGESITFDTFTGKVLNAVAQPMRPPWGLRRWRIEHACKKRGGHWWHPEGMIGWFCCQCGAERDGMPKDGE